MYNLQTVVSEIPVNLGRMDELLYVVVHDIHLCRSLLDYQTLCCNEVLYTERSTFSSKIY